MSVATVSKVSNFDNATKGTVFSETQFYVVEKKVGDELEVINEAGESITLPKGYVDTCLISADTFTKEEKITRTELQQKIIAASGVVVTINFRTKVDEKVLFEEVMGNVRGATMSQIEDAIKKGIKKGIKGEERTIKGRHFGELNPSGRLDFIDMEIPLGGNRQRQVDPRTAEWAIIRGVKYIVK